MKKFLLIALFIVGFVGAVYAAVEVQSNGTLVGKAETLNITGATTTVSGKDATIAVGNISTGLYVDGSLYLTGASGGTGMSTLWLTQQDGGCSRCEVSNAGTVFSCADQTCPSGM